MKNNGVFYIVMVLITVGFVTQGHASQEKPLAYLPEQTYSFQLVMEGTEVAHDFVLQNKGQAPLEIKKLKSG